MKKLSILSTSNNSRTINTFRNIGTGFVSQGILYLVGILNRIVFIRCLSAEYLGVNGLFSNVLSMLSLAELGIGTAIVFALYKPLADRNKKEIAALMHFYGKAYKIIGCVVAGVGLILLPFMNIIIGTTPNIKENLTVIYLLYLFNTSLNYFFSYKTSLLNADQKNYIITSVSTITTVLQSIAQWLVLLIFQNFILYLIVQSVFIFLYNVSISVYVNKTYKYINTYKNEKIKYETKKILFVNIKALIVTKVSGVLVNCTDNIIITALQGLVITGVNSNYVLLTNTLNGILSVVFSGMTGSIGNANSTMDEEEKYRLFTSVNLLNFWLYGWSAIAFVILSNDLIAFFFGKQYVVGMSIVVIMAVNYYTVGMQNAVWTFYNTLGLYRYGQYLGLITGLINIVFSILLGKMWGLFGILLATFISRLFTNIWYSPYVLFEYGLKKSFLLYCIKYIKYILILIITLVINYYLVCFSLDNLLLSLILKIIINIFVPNIIFSVIFFRTAEFKYIISKISFLVRKGT